MIALLLSAWLALPADNPVDLQFHSSLDGWNSEGFHICTAGDLAPFNENYVTSNDRDGHGHKALLHRLLSIPADAGVISFKAYVVRGPGSAANDKLDIALLAAGKQIIPKEVRTPKGWQPVDRVLPAQDGRPREYIWRVSAYAGQAVRIVLVDEDDRPGCSLYCGGFHVISGNDFDGPEFSAFMVRLASEHKLAPMTRFDSAHFIALSNAEEGVSERRLQDCELLYALFYDHFGRRGFPCRQPASKLMVAIFDAQAGFEAYLGRKTSGVLTGIYHPSTNRMVMYDYGQNEAMLSSKRRAEQAGQHIGSPSEKAQFLGSVLRQAQQYRQTASVGTITHEVAHQLSFNCGMLNRQGDVPAWLAEGLACYCEPTVNGSWQGIGELDPGRLRALVDVFKPDGKSHDPISLWDLRQLLESDDWVRGGHDAKAMLLGYAQCWALFRMLMEEQPQALRKYLSLVYAEQVPERRLADFEQVFGSNLKRFEQHYRDYMRKLVQAYSPPKRNP